MPDSPTGEELPDPPIPDVPSHTPIAPARATRRGATRTTVPIRFAYRERVRITEPAAPALVGLHGVVRRYRTDGDTGATIYLVEIDGPAATLAHREQWFTEDALEELPAITATAKPAHPVLPSLRPGDRVLITLFARPTYGSIITVESDPARYYVAVDDGSEEWYWPRDLKPASSPLDRRTPTLIVTVPLTDPSERPQTVEALIDLIAERWQETGWSVDP